MAKSIKLDAAAYERLKSIRRDDESSSAVVKRSVRPKLSVANVLNILRQSAPSLETLSAIDETVTRRRRQPRLRKA